MLEVRNLTKRYASIPAVDNVSFVIRPSQILGYLAPNGSGKSTTVKVLVGLMEPSSGVVLFQGRNIRDDLAAYKRRLGFVPGRTESLSVSFRPRISATGGKCRLAG